VANAPSAPPVSLTQLASAADRAAAKRDHATTSPSALRTLTSPASPSPTMSIVVADAIRGRKALSTAPSFGAIAQWMEY
jgi:hypothetical protein